MNKTDKRDHKLEKLIIDGYYYEAMEYIADFSLDKVFSYLSSFAYEEDSLVAYAFSCFMYEQTGSEEWCDFIVTLSYIELVYIEGMNCVQVYYSRELVRINRSVENMSCLLEANVCPDTCYLIDKSESLLLAEEILKYDPSERVANKYMKDLERGYEEDCVYHEENFTTCLEMGLYEKALGFLEHTDGVGNREFFVEYAKREQSIEIYNFIRYMINKTKSFEWMKTAVDVLTTGLESLKDYGVYDIASFHIREMERVKRQ